MSNRCGTAPLGSGFRRPVLAGRAVGLGLPDVRVPAPAGPAPRAGIRTIPVVVHVVSSSRRSDVSDDRIRLQIAELTEDFTATNDDLDTVPVPSRR